jgi:hypothetical protein
MLGCPPSNLFVAVSVNARQILTDNLQSIQYFLKFYSFLKWIFK